MATISAGQAVAEALSQLGVRNVIGMAGSCLLEILDGMYGREDMHFLTVRHEQCAALMADGFGRMSGRPGVCLANNGPGATNLLTGIANAKHAQSPVLAITGAPMMKDMFRDSSQEVDQVSLFRPLVKWSAQVRKPERAAEIIREAYQVAISGVPGPVHVDLPRDVMNEEVPLPKLSGPMPPPISRAAPDPVLLAQAAAWLGEAERPLILAGGGVIWAEATADLLALAETLDAPILGSTGRDDVAPGSHRLFMGTLAGVSSSEAKKLLREADVVLAVGTRLAHPSTFFDPNFFGVGTKLIHVAVEPRNIGRHYPADLGIVGDAGLTLRGLTESSKPKSRPAWNARAAEVRAFRQRHRETCLKLDGKPIDPRRAHAALAKVMPKDTVITADAGSACSYIYGIYQFEKPRSIFSHRDFVPIGVGYPVGLGAKLARPDRTVVTVCGDGAFLFNGVEIETAVREKINTVCIILNNFTLGSERAYQRHYFEERFIGEAIGNPPFDEFARVFGAVGYRVTDSADLEDVFAEALRQDRPVLVDVICDPDTFPQPRRSESVKASRKRA